MDIKFWDAAEWSAFSEMLFAAAAIIAGGWAVYNYSRSKKAEVARWVKEIFYEFYVSDKFDSIRTKIEYEFEGNFEQLVTQRFFDRSIVLNTDEKKLLKELDTLLNYFEHLLYLERRGQLQKRDRNAIFEYWFDILRAPERAILRLYTVHFGFERIARELKAVEKHYFVSYGTLQRNFPAHTELQLEGMLKYVKRCTFKGTMVDMGEYPALVPGEGRIHGDLFEVLDTKAFSIIDKFEKYYAHDHKKSLYIRKCLTLMEPKVEAWVYQFNNDINGKPVIESGKWESKS